MEIEESQLAHIVAQVVENLGGLINKQRVLDKVEQFMRGLPAESEFVALCTWMGQCMWIHKLDQEVFPSEAKEILCIPDLLGMFTYENQKIPALIEVKRTKTNKKLVFSGKCMRRLRAYSDVTGLPLLIAWKQEEIGTWALFDIDRMELKKTAYHISLENALRTDLTGVLLGNVFISVTTGVAIKLVFEKEGDIQRDHSGAVVQFTGRLRKVVPINAAGEEFPQLYPLVEALFALIPNESRMEEDERYLYMFFTADQDPRGVIAYSLLRAFVSRGNMETAKLNYLSLVRTGRFPIEYAKFKDSLSMGSEQGLLESVIHNVPDRLPSFLGG